LDVISLDFKYKLLIFNYLNTKIPDFNDFYNKNFKKGFHIHTPSTATPKDGPSAGCAFTCAFISRILNKPISNEIGMTGEIELTGKITKIGGLNFKLFGAKKAGIKIVYIPKENAEDLNEIIEKDNKLIDENFNVYQVDYVSEIIDSIIK
jgi:ATP-dependent Lon protease